MDKLHKLESRKLLKEFDYIKSELDFKSEIIFEADSSFLQSLGDILDKNDDLKNFFNKSLNSELDFISEVSVSTKVFSNETHTTDSDRIENIIKYDNNLKKIYREVVKKTHPDKVNDLILNNFYIQIGNMYERNDIIGIYNICEQLEIDYDMSEKDFEIIINEIINLKQRIKFLESTITWKWYNSNNQIDRDKIILDYIKSKII